MSSKKYKHVIRPIMTAPCSSDVLENISETHSPSPLKTTHKDYNLPMNIKSPLLTPCRSIGLKRKPVRSSANNSGVLLSATGMCSHVGLSRTMSSHHLSSPSLENVKSSITVPKSVKKLRISGPKKREYTQSYLEELKTRVAEKQKKLSSCNVLEPKLNVDFGLQAEILLWRRGCQEALEDLLQHIHAKQGNENENQGKMNMSTLLQHLDIPAILVNYDSDNQEFN